MKKDIKGKVVNEKIEPEIADTIESDNTGKGEECEEELEEDNKQDTEVVKEEKEKGKSLIGRFKEAGEEYDALVRGVDVVEEKVSKTEIVTKIFIVLLAAAIFTVCFMWFKYSSHLNEINISKISLELNKPEVYQYDIINPDNIIVKIKGEKFAINSIPKGYKYELIQPTYSDEVIGVILNNHVYTLKCNLIKVESIDWVLEEAYDGEKRTNSEWEEVAKKSLQGVIHYEDGTNKKVTDIKDVKVITESGIRVLEFVANGNTYNWTPDGGLR